MSVSETIALNDDEDAYADAEMCKTCPLPNIVTSYEVGFRLLQEQLVGLQQDVLRMAAKIDVFERNVLGTDAERA